MYSSIDSGIGTGVGVAVGGIGVAVGGIGVAVGSAVAVAVGGTEVDVGITVGIDVGIDVGTEVAVGGKGVGVAVGGNGVAVFTISAKCFSSRASTIASTSSVLTPQATTRSINPAMNIYVRYFMFTSRKLDHI